MKAFALTIPHIVSKIRTKTSTIIKAMDRPLAKIADSEVNRCITRDQSLIQYRWIYKLIKSNLIIINRGVQQVKDNQNNDNKLNSQNTQIYPYLDKIMSTCYGHKSIRNQPRGQSKWFLPYSIRTFNHRSISKSINDQTQFTALSIGRPNRCSIDSRTANYKPSDL